MEEKGGVREEEAAVTCSAEDRAAEGQVVVVTPVPSLFAPPPPHFPPLPLPPSIPPYLRVHVRPCPLPDGLGVDALWLKCCCPSTENPPSL